MKSVQRSTTGLFHAMAIVLPWLCVAIVTINVEPVKASVGLTLLLICAKCYLNTGLFIVAHDSMHGTLSPSWPRINKVIGAAALFLYAGLSYSSCKRKHLLHHLAPETSLDPDYRKEHEASFVKWFARFLCSYTSVGSLVILGMGWALVYSQSVDPFRSVILFGAVPLVLSSIQLFTFGIWMPHKPGKGSARNTPRSNYFSPIVSLLTCYNFGYHREHHENPHVPWYQLYRLAIAKI